MKVLQFVDVDSARATTLKTQIIDQLNVWSRLSRLSNSPDYATSTFSLDEWKPHLSTVGLHWINWDAVYANLGDDGRLVADYMFSDDGKLLGVPLLPIPPETKLELVEVADLVSSGYLADPTPMGE